MNIGKLYIITNIMRFSLQFAYGYGKIIEIISYIVCSRKSEMSSMLFFRSNEKER